MRRTAYAQCVEESRLIAQAIHEADRQYGVRGSLQSLEQRLAAIQHQLGKERPMSLSKRILITLGIAFLSACTVRYWIDKLEPYVQGYIIEHTRPALYEDVKKVLEGYRR